MRRPIWLTLTLTACGWFGGDAEPAPADARRTHANGVDAPETVVLVVMDTVRADHTSACGYERPTTPVLAKLAKDGALSCRTYSPGAWTHPSHASMLTGLTVPEHGAIWVTDSAVAINPVTKVRPLDASFTTVTERFAEAGYQTLAVSANMILTPASGVLQGFEQVFVSETMQGFRGPRFRPALRKALTTVDPDRPLFLLINLYDAHDPYPAIPEGTPWAPPQPRTHLRPEEHNEANPYYRYVKGLSSDDEAAPFLQQVVDGYDEGIREADRNLGVALGMLRKQRFLDRGHRLVVTSDHGEMLGEHRLLRHGGYTHEGMTRVPLLVVDTTGDVPTLPDPLTGRAVHDLLMDGTVPAMDVASVSEANEQDVLVGVNGASWWDGATKHTTTAEGTVVVDLASDPGEDAPTVAEPPAGLAALWTAVVEMLARPAPDEPVEVREALKALGYADE